MAFANSTAFNSFMKMSRIFEPKNHMQTLAIKAEAYDCANPNEREELESTIMDGLDKAETFDTAKLIALCQKDE